MLWNDRQAGGGKGVAAIRPGSGFYWFGSDRYGDRWNHAGPVPADFGGFGYLPVAAGHRGYGEADVAYSRPTAHLYAREADRPGWYVGARQARRAARIAARKARNGWWFAWAAMGVLAVWVVQVLLNMIGVI